MKKIGLELVGFVAAAIAFVLVYLGLSRLLPMASSVPVLGTILGYPGGSGRVMSILILCISISVGGFITLSISHSSKIFSWIIIILLVVSGVKMLLDNAFNVGRTVEIMFGVVSCIYVMSESRQPKKVTG